MSITVENNTGNGDMLEMGDHYEVSTGSEATYPGALKWTVADGEKTVIDSSKFIKQLKQYMEAQSIRVVAGDAPPLILCHADFTGKAGHRLVFTMAETDGAPCLIHRFFPGNGGGMSNFFKIWYS